MSDDNNVQGSTPEPVQPDPASSPAGQSEVKAEAPLENIPEQYREKSPEDLIKMHSELEKKLGEQSQTISEYNQLKQTVAQLESVLAENPELYEGIKSAVIKKTTAPEPSKRDGEGKSDPVANETRQYAVNTILNSFQSKFGFTQLKPEERKAEFEKVVKEFLEIRDPGGQKDLKTVLSETPLDSLPNLLEKAYWVANVSSAVDSNNQVDFASIGRMPSSTRKSEPQTTLTEEERTVARNLGISEKDYLAEKQKLLQK